MERKTKKIPDNKIKGMPIYIKETEIVHSNPAKKTKNEETHIRQPTDSLSGN